MIVETDIPEGYNGKILMVAILDESFGVKRCLRSGDLWHREILRNTQNEIIDLGFTKSAVYELGGANVKSDSKGNIIIFGTSNDFGSCDKKLAAKFIKNKFPDKNVTIKE